MMYESIAQQPHVKNGFTMSNLLRCPFRADVPELLISFALIAVPGLLLGCAEEPPPAGANPFAASPNSPGPNATPVAQAAHHAKHDQTYAKHEQHPTAVEAHVAPAAEPLRPDAVPVPAAPSKTDRARAQAGDDKANRRSRTPSPPVNSEANPAQSLAQIERQGGKVRYDEKSPGRPVVAIDFSGTPLNDAGLRSVSGLTTLKSLNLKQTRISGQGLANLRNLPNLKVLYLDGTRITNADLRHLQNLSALEEVYLHNTRVNGVGANALKKVMPKLKVVH